MTPTFSERVDQRAKQLRRDDQRDFWDDVHAEDSAKKSTKRVHERSMLDAFLTDRRAVYAPDAAILSAFLSVLPLDVEDVLDDIVGTGREWRSGDRAVLFFPPDDDTRRLFAPEHLAEHPAVRVFASDVGLRLDHQFDQFESAGLNLDDFAASWPVDSAETEAAERFYAAPQAFATLELSVLHWFWSRLSAEKIRADSARLNACETQPEAFAELTRQHRVAEAHELAYERDNPPDDNAEDDDHMTDTAPADEPERNAPLDLRRLRTEERAPIDYLEPGVVPRGRYLGLSGEAGAGKSVLMRDMAVRWSLGRSAFDPAHRFTPARVVYLDAENGPDWWAEGLDNMDAPLDLPNLRVITYPELAGGIDTERGAGSFLALVESLGEIDVLVIDTASRFIAGSENDSDTWHALYRNAILPLRRAGIGIIRLDHLGKNAELGARGSSAKMSDLDAHYILTATAKGSNSLALKLDKRRQADYDESVRVTRMDGPLAHVRVPEGKLALKRVAGRDVPEDEKVAALVAELDRLHISHVLSRRVQQQEYIERDGAVKASTRVWTDAVAHRADQRNRVSEG